MNHVHLENHVVIHEIREGGLIGHDAADFCSREENILRLFSLEECLHSLLAAQIQLLVRTGNDVGIALTQKFADYGRAHHPPVTRNVYLTVLFHYLTIPFSRYSARLVLTFAATPSPATLAISESTIIFTRSSKLVLEGFQPSMALAFVGSPHRLTTSVGL